MKLKCPLCSKELIKEEKTYSCLCGHSFDISKEGYTNLLMKQSRKEFGDSVMQVNARRNFFATDPYRPLKERVAEVLKSLSTETIVDSGCGEGYYTNYIQSQLPQIDVFGLDISKEAVRLASRHSKANYFVASNQALPFYDKSIETLLNMFAPIDEKECARVLKDDGSFVTVQVGADHLLGLKKALYDDVYFNEVNYLQSEFSLSESEKIDFTIHLNSQKEIQDLFHMTPYYYHTSRASKEKLEKLEELDTLCSFVLQIYHKKK
mgnify:CR=1 FL=1